MAFLLKGVHAVDPQLNLDKVVDVLIDGKTIARVADDIEKSDGDEVIDGSGKYLVPGLVDMHVHFRDPGFEYKETIESGARAATHGGFSDVATMPNTDPVTDTGTGVRYQVDRAHAANLCHVRPIGALTRGQKGEALAEIGDMVMEGAAAFSDDGHGVQSAGMMRTCMDYVSQFDRVAIAHCEDESLTTHGVINEGKASTRLGMFGWPALGEELEIYRDIELVRLTGCPLHIAHISTRKGLELVKAAKADGLPVTCEVTPHHIFLNEDDITDAYNTNLKMNPPLRREGLRVGDCLLWHHRPRDLAAPHAHQARVHGRDELVAPGRGHGRQPAPRAEAQAGHDRGGLQGRPHAHRPGQDHRGHARLLREQVQELRLHRRDAHRRRHRRLRRRPPHPGRRRRPGLVTSSAARTEVRAAPTRR